jgi:hypothetical protein
MNQNVITMPAIESIQFVGMCDLCPDDLTAQTIRDHLDSSDLLHGTNDLSLMCKDRFLGVLGALMDLLLEDGDDADLDPDVLVHVIEIVHALPEGCFVDLES